MEEVSEFQREWAEGMKEDWKDWIIRSEGWEWLRE